ncbi:hypothetical protein BCR42DRAFT_402017 [Absidia repens]|uniref:Uncharacterized protein n=1 Tax=Absidia repens TaxID=90262 RepID=A0A1X2IXF2_9FUNG|nr:hypothetical protein BCR42DRAFT_402017 [Absidia repens]
MEQQHAYQLTENLLRSPTPLSHQSSRNSRVELLNKRASSPMTDASTPPPPPLVSSLPNNAVVFQPPQAPDSSFHNYIDRQFQQDAPVLKSHLDKTATDDHHRPDNHFGNEEKHQMDIVDMERNEPSTLWAAIKTDLDRHGESSLAHHDPQQHEEHGHEKRPWWAWDHDDGIASIGAVLFLFGFIFPPLWWVGAFWPKRPERGGKMATRWQQLNRYFSIGFSVILVIVIIVVAALYGTSQ